MRYLNQMEVEQQCRCTSHWVCQTKIVAGFLSPPAQLYSFQGPQCKESA